MRFIIKEKIFLTGEYWNHISTARNWTRVSRVRGKDTNHYTIDALNIKIHWSVFSYRSRNKGTRPSIPVKFKDFAKVLYKATHSILFKQSILLVNLDKNDTNNRKSV